MAKKTYQQIQEEIQRLQKEAAALRDAEVAEVVAKIRTAIDAYGLTAADLGFSVAAARTRKPGAKPAGKGSSKKPARAAKYRDSDGNSWSGVGKRPRWFVAALASGKTPEDLLAR
jgi:DNA-binding protein H-NS